jgi:mRNA-degrading endonuclease RelE of RelBE toxin-antitoxin system
MPYEIVIERTARKDIEKINKAEQILIIQAIAELADEPAPNGM